MDFSAYLGPTNPCMFANFKETFPATVLKAMTAVRKIQHRHSFQ